jgi:hypothetical protein
MMGFDEKGMDESVQLIISNDSEGKPLEGQKKYMIHLPSPIPASDFWSIVVYDQSSHLIIHSDQEWPSVYSNKTHLIINSDGSVDAYFGPETIKGKEYNCVKTLPGRRWYMILRLYNPLQSWFNKTWQPGEITALI